MVLKLAEQRKTEKEKLLGKAASEEGIYKELAQAFVDFEGAGSMMVDPRSKTERLAMKVEMLGGAATAVEQGRACMRDMETGLGFDDGLW